MVSFALNNICFIPNLPIKNYLHQIFMMEIAAGYDSSLQLLIILWINVTPMFQNIV